METVTTISVFLVVFVTCQIKAYSKQEIYNHGDNATVLIDKTLTDGRKHLEIYFSGFTNKLRDIHMIIIVPNKNNEIYIKVSSNYSGRIKDINMNNENITFLLLNVSVMDSGNYRVFEGSLEKGKRSILVTRRILNGQLSKPMILPFMCINTNTSSIKIVKSHAFDYVDDIIYDVARKSCTYTNHSQDYMGRNFSCVLIDANFDLTFRELLWSDKGAYIAWDDQELLLDALFLGIPDDITSSPPGTSTPDSSSHQGEHGKFIWLLVSTVVSVLLLACLAISAVRKLRHRKGKKTKEEEINCSDPDQRMFQVTNTALQSNDDDDERIYHNPRSNGMELTAYIEPISQPVNVYERLHPYENQGNNMYRSLRPDTKDLQSH